MEFKHLTVYVDNVPKFIVPLMKTTKVGDIKQYFAKTHPNHYIRLLIKTEQDLGVFQDQELGVFHTNEYDNMDISSVWDSLENGIIFLGFNQTESDKSVKHDKHINTVCLKVGSLRKTYRDENISLKKWMEDPNNLYVGRQGRIFITYSDIDPNTGNKRREIFHYKGSKWQNPYKVGKKTGEYTLDQSLKLYREHVIKTGLVNQLRELEGKTLGCFCDQSGDCHAKTLVSMYNEFVK